MNLVVVAEIVVCFKGLLCRSRKFDRAKLGVGDQERVTWTLSIGAQSWHRNDVEALTNDKTFNTATITQPPVTLPGPTQISSCGRHSPNGLAMPTVSNGSALCTATWLTTLTAVNMDPALVKYASMSIYPPQLWIEIRSLTRPCRSLR